MDLTIETFADPADRLAALTGIIEAPDGRVWFTSPGTDRIGRIDPVTGAIETFVDPAGELRARRTSTPGPTAGCGSPAPPRISSAGSIRPRPIRNPP